ncbi:hypothetical protein BJ878DRAFT_537235 [Calycina marina]|uniref:NAD-dependent epimerase/dehydratase domain-containing protein n=1 Tax=Calycina marina TaxID=1763456 RepID=A0A9P7YVZ5_9HELO|nr:hypothetical protein BJ878DRAFT_537235 [Calycina marina]
MAPKNMIVTGSGRLIGPLLSACLLNDGYHNAICRKGNICDPAYAKELLSLAQSLHAIIIFHDINSAGSEANYDFSGNINVESAVSVQPLRATVTSSVTSTPEVTYGAHKYASEIMINDMHRKKFINSFIVRFSTLVVRPGLLRKLVASWLSGRSFHSHICSPIGVIENLSRVLNLKSDALPPHVRYINIPDVLATTQELVDGMAKYGGEDNLKYLKETNEGFERIPRSQPQALDPSTPYRLG